MDLINKFSKDLRLIKKPEFFNVFIPAKINRHRTFSVRSAICSPSLSSWVAGEFLSCKGTVMGKAEVFFFIKIVRNFTVSARHCTPWTGTSYARTDNVTWSHLAFAAKDETHLALAKFKTRISLRLCLVNDFLATFPELNLY